MVETLQTAPLHTNNALQPLPLDLTAYVFFSFDEPALHNVGAVVRLLLAQLSIGSLVPKEINAFQHNNGSPSDAEFEDALFKTLGRLRADYTCPEEGSSARIRSVTIVLDALDELPPGTQKNRVLAFITRLHHFAQKPALFQLRLALFTRPESSIKDLCLPAGCWTVAEVPPNEIKRDISIFIRQSIEDHPRMRNQADEKKQNAVEVVTGAAQGMFRLAALYMEELTRWNGEIADRYLQKMLDTTELPRDLDTYYSRILQRINPVDKRCDMFVMLKWILIAARPMSVEELLDASATLPPEDPRIEFDEERRGLCRDFDRQLNGLVSLDTAYTEDPVPLGAEYTKQTRDAAPHRVARFAHFSVREFLLRFEHPIWLSDLPRYSLDLAQSYATDCCLAYLAQCQRSPDGRTDHWPWRSYAWHHWAMHASAHRALHAPAATSRTTYASRSIQLSTHPTSKSLKLYNHFACPILYTGTEVAEFHHTVEALQVTLNQVKRSIVHLIGINKWNALIDLGGQYTEGMFLTSIHFLMRFMRPSTSLLPTCVHDRAGRILDVLQDPEYPHDFTQEDLESIDRRPLYRERGRPDFSHHVLRRKKSLQVSEVRVVAPPGLCEMPRPTFSFSPLPPSLKAIRLLLVHPCNEADSTIVCSQYTDSLDNKPLYTALSYVWDYTEKTNTVFINGRECTVRTNLHLALQELRQKKEICVLWVDSLCMSMQDLNERGAQVRSMDEIYRNAISVVMWMGPGTPDSDASMDCLQVTSTWGYRPLVFLGRPSCQYCLTQLFKHHIWHKIWILLECVLATKPVIAWGRYRLKWDDITDVQSASVCLHPRITKTGSETSLPPSPTMRPMELLQTYKDLRKHRFRLFHNHQITLPQFLYRTRHFAVSEPVDKIITMIHLLPDDEQQAVSELIDYNLSPVDIYVSAATYCLKGLKNLDLLSINNPLFKNQDGILQMQTVYRGERRFETRLEGLPSWVPAWNCLHWTSSLAPGAFDPVQQVLFNAGGRQIEDSFQVQSRELLVEGFTLEILCYAVDIQDVLASEFDISGLLRESWTDVDGTFAELAQRDMARASFVGRYPRPAAQREAVTRTVSACSADDARFPGSLQDSWYPSAELWAAAEEAERCYAGHRRLCFGHDGHIALVPSWSVENDVIAIFRGGAVPYVLREMSPGRYSLIGEWFVPQSRSPTAHER
ncbi:hypothetical protein LTR97_004317 [Elasticomyces elasticus]|uniref:Heterokaryon incompatibility domain-containing protein n=1 Tax=Elasticomyces elasticus TaxID=574655 RepID=A0AAN8A382_9PEZI|nr:hypothetical protein LTR97_004317 [Elasticomyces elasticus]